jgi:hypothetical protein
MRRVIALFACTAALAVVLGASSGAATPAFKLGTYKGKTSQHNPVTFTLAKSQACFTGKVVNGVEQFKPGTCLTILNLTPKIVGPCSNGNPPQSGSKGGNYLVPRSGVIKLHDVIGQYDLKLSFTIGRDGRAKGTGHFHEEFLAAPNATAPAVNVVCDSGNVTFTAKRTGK